MIPPVDADVTRFADMFAAMGAEPRLRIVRLLLAAHPTGMTAGDIAAELAIAASTLSHHLERLKREEVIDVTREGTFLRYTANTAALEALLRFLFAECCSRSQAINPEALTWIPSRPSSATATPKPPDA
jgi:DNA-binding transcriptional ArsR family regulator